MKKESFTKFFSIRKKAALLLAAAMMLPMFASGCESAQEIIKKRERADEITKRAEQYMQDKYNRGFKVKKCEAAEGEKYKDDYFITFNNGISAFYDADEDMFFDDRQVEPINEAIMRDIWTPMFDDLHVLYDYVNDQSQVFNMVYSYTRGGQEYKYSMYNGYFETTPQYFAVHSELSVTSDNIIFVIDDVNKCMNLFDKMRVIINGYFKGQKRGDLNIYAVTTELHSRNDFDPAMVDETTEGCIAHYHFGENQYCSYTGFGKVMDGLYGEICHLHGITIGDGAILLTPVEDTEAVKKSIVESMDSKEIGLIDKYTAKKRDIDFGDAIYKAEFSPNINQKEWKKVTVAFKMTDSNEPIGEYAEINEAERSFFGYNLNGTAYNATCLCSPNSRSVMFDYNVGDEVYFWFGSQK